MPVQRSNVVPLRPATTSDAAGTSDLSHLALLARTQEAELRLLVERLQSHSQLRLLAARLGQRLSSHGADDLMQLTLERVVRGIASYRGAGDVLGWVGRIMRNTQVEWRRKETGEDAKLADYWLERRGSHDLDPADSLADQEMRDRVLEVWRGSSGDAEMQLFWERTYVGLSVEQLMRRTGHPRSTVYYMLKKGGAKFLREWKRLANRRVSR